VELNNNLSTFEKENTVVIAAVTDPLQFSEEIAKEQNIEIPIMYDLNHEVGSKYGVYNVPGGMDMGPVDTHSVFVIDKEGTIQWSEISIQEMYVPLDSIVEEVKKL
jgi:peroxiredoxin